MSSNVDLALWDTIEAEIGRTELRIGDTRWGIDPDVVGKDTFRRIYPGWPFIHYEFIVRAAKGVLDIAVHIEKRGDRDESVRMLARLREHAAAIGAGVDGFYIGDFNDGDSHPDFQEIRYRITADNPWSPELAPEAVRLMKLLITRSYPIMKAQGMLEQRTRSKGGVR